MMKYLRNCTQGIIVSPTGWTNAATIDSVYDLLHMMGRDDIPVGLGDVFAMNQSDPVFGAVGECKYIKAIPHGSGGLLDSDTLYGLARDLPRSPRRCFSVTFMALNVLRINIIMHQNSCVTIVKCLCILYLW